MVVDPSESARVLLCYTSWSLATNLHRLFPLTKRACHYQHLQGIMVRVVGFEPTISCFRNRKSNQILLHPVLHLRSPGQFLALLQQAPRGASVLGAGYGSCTRDDGLEDHHVAATPNPHMSTVMERAARIELAWSSLARKYITILSRPHLLVRSRRIELR